MIIIERFIKNEKAQLRNLRIILIAIFLLGIFINSNDTFSITCANLTNNSRMGFSENLSITNHCRINNLTLYMLGNITITSGGIFNLTNVSILFNTSDSVGDDDEDNDKLNLIVEDGGIFYMNSSKITNNETDSSCLGTAAPCSVLGKGTGEPCIAQAGCVSGGQDCTGTVQACGKGVSQYSEECDRQIGCGWEGFNYMIKVKKQGKFEAHGSEIRNTGDSIALGAGGSNFSGNITIKNSNITHSPFIRFEGDYAVFDKVNFSKNGRGFFVYGKYTNITNSSCYSEGLFGCLSLAGNNSIITESTFINGSDGEEYGVINWDASNVYFNNNTVRESAAGLILGKDADVFHNVISNNTFENLIGAASLYPGGIIAGYFWMANYINITKNLFRNIDTAGINTITASHNASITYNTFINSSNNSNFGVISLSTLNDDWEIKHNTFNASREGILITNTLKNVTIINNTFYNLSSNGIRITEAASNITLINNTFMNNTGAGFSLASASAKDVFIYDNLFCFNKNGSVNNLTYMAVGNNTFCINLVTTINNTINSSVDQTFSFLINDTFNFNTECNLTIDGNQNKSRTNIFTNGPHEINSTLQTDNNYTWSIRCIDIFGNKRSADETRFIILIRLDGVNISRPNDQNTDILNNITYTIIVGNNGSASDTVLLNVTNNNSLNTATLNQSVISSLAAGSTANVTLTIGHSTAGNFSVDVNTSSSTTPAVFHYQTIYTNINWTYGAKITDPNDLNANTSSNVTYTITVTNNGTDADRYIMNVTNNNSFDTLSLNQTRVNLSAGASATVEIIVGHSASGNLSFDFNMTSQNQTNKWSYITVYTNIGRITYGVNLSRPNDQDTDTTANATYTIIVGNNGSSTDTVRLNITNNNSLDTALFNQSTVTLTTGTTANVTLTIGHSTAGNFSLDINASSNSNTTVFHYRTIYTNINWTHGANITTLTPNRPTEVNINTTYTFIITNNGTDKDDIILNVTNNNSIDTAKLNQSYIGNLSAGSKANVTIIVGHDISGNYSIDVNATSKNQTNKWHIVTIRANITDIPPNVTLNSPVNNSFDADGAVQFNITVDDLNAKNCTLFGNFNRTESSINQTIDISGLTENGTEKNFSKFVTLSDNNTGYAWNVSCRDESNNEGISEIRRINVDSTTPVVTQINASQFIVVLKDISGHFNGSRYLQNGTINITATVNGSNLDKVLLYYNNTGTGNATWASSSVIMTNLTNDSYNASVIFTNHSTNISFMIIANNSANNTNIRNNSGNFYIFTIDISAPSGALTITPTVFDPGGKVTLSCTSTDDLALGTGNVTNNIDVLNPNLVRSSNVGTSFSSTKLAGTYTVYCISQDLAQNNASVSKTFTVATSEGGGGGGGAGGSAGATVTGQSAVMIDIRPGVENSVELLNVDKTGIEKISVEVNERIAASRITVNALDSRPAETKALSEKVYKYLEIKATNLEYQLNKATIKFRIENKWFEDNNLDNNEVSLKRYAEGNWQNLKTNFLSQDSENTHYSAETSGFSYFVITAKEKEAPKVTEEAVAEPEKAKGIVEEAIKVVKARKSMFIVLVSIFALFMVAISIFIYFYYKKRT